MRLSTIRYQRLPDATTGSCTSVVETVSMTPHPTATPAAIRTVRACVVLIEGTRSPGPATVYRAPIAPAYRAQSVSSTVPAYPMDVSTAMRSEEPTSELQSLMRLSYAV